MYVTSLSVNYPLKNTSIAPALYTFGESASVMQFVYRVHFPTILRKMHKNEKYQKIPLYIVYLPITRGSHRTLVSSPQMLQAPQTEAEAFEVQIFQGKDRVLGAQHLIKGCVAK